MSREKWLDLERIVAIPHTPTGSDKPGHVQSSQNPAHWWTLPEATSALGVNERTLRRWIKRDKIEACKVRGLYGEEWRIKPGPPSECSLDKPGQNKPSPGTASPPTLDSPVSISELLETKVKLSMLEQENKQLKQQLQGATYRNGYLESKLEERNHSIKLLTDSQHKRGHWSRFWSWFTGSPFRIKIQ